MSRTLRPLDIANPYNPELAKNLGIKNNLTKSTVQSRTSDKGKPEYQLIGNNKLRGSIS